MSHKLAYERYNWFHCQIKARGYPNASKLSQRFELSLKQAQRDIEFMRDRLQAPLVYTTLKRGYEYGDAGYELPPIWFREDDLIALCLAMRLATTIPDRKLKSSLQGLLDKFLLFRSTGPPVRLKDVQDRISVKNIHYYRTGDESIFNRAVGAILKGEPLKISYYTPHKGETTERVIQPLHLLMLHGELAPHSLLHHEKRDTGLRAFPHKEYRDKPREARPSRFHSFNKGICKEKLRSYGRGGIHHGLP